MDAETIINFINFFTHITTYLKEIVENFNETQWMFLIIGALLIVIGIYGAWRSERIAKYNLCVAIAKAGTILVIIAFAWNNIVWLYEKGLELTGNPLAAILLIIAGAFIGFNTIKTILSMKKNK